MTDFVLLLYIFHCFLMREIWKCQEKTVYLQQILERYSLEARSFVFLSFSSYEYRGNNAVITRLSRANHALLVQF